MTRVAEPFTDADQLAFEEGMRRAEELSERLSGPSLAEELTAALALQPNPEAILAAFSPLECARLLYDWEFWARPKQRWPANTTARVLFYLAGRSSGKTRSGAEWIREQVNAGAMLLAIVGPTLKKIRQFMLGGRAGKKKNGSGLLDVFPPHQRPVWKEQKGELWFHTGAMAFVHSSEDTEFRGANLEAVWCDEIVAWDNAEELWDNIEMTMRVEVDGDVSPRIFVTSTGDDLPVIKKLIGDPETITILGDTDENRSNVDAGWLARVQRRYGGTATGERELKGGVREAGAGKLFDMPTIRKYRVAVAPRIVRGVVAVDPAISTHERNDDTGIIVEGIDGREHVYVQEDHTGKYLPEEWSDCVVDALIRTSYNVVVIEINRGGQMCTGTMRSALDRAVLAGKMSAARRSTIRVIPVNSVGEKGERAEPLSGLMRDGIIHVVGELVALEREITTWRWRGKGKSPNRLDALALGAWELLGLSKDRDLVREPDPGIGRVNREWKAPGYYEQPL